MWSRSNLVGALAFVALAAAAPALPAWLVSLATIAFANALVVLGLVILWRAGLVPFGQALFYAIGAYLTLVLSPYIGFGGSFIVAPVAVALLGMVVERTLYWIVRCRRLDHPL